MSRARQAAWTGALVAGLLTEVIGLAAAWHPQAWLGLFGQDLELLTTGASYLRIVGPFYGLFGFSLALYFAGQGAGRVGWPLVASILRMVISLGGAWLAVAFGLGLPGIFAALAAGLVAMGVVNVAAYAKGATIRLQTAQPLGRTLIDPGNGEASGHDHLRPAQTGTVR